MRILVQPASGTEAKKHYEDTISAGINPLLLKGYLTEEEYSKVLSISPYRVQIWGIVPREAGIPRSQWVRLSEGDIAVFYKEKRFYFVANVLYKKHIKRLAQDLWGQDKDGRTWEYIYFLKPGNEISVKYVPSVLGYKKNHVFQGAQLLSEEQSEKLLDYLIEKSGELIDEEDVEPTQEEVASFSSQVRKVNSPEEAKKEIERLAEILKNKPVRERIKNAKSLVRNPRIARLIKEQANYTCEICGTLPFIKKSGIPYAEAHHIYELAVSRIDHPNQMMCVCPTCHRVIHYGNDESLKQRESLKN